MKNKITVKTPTVQDFKSVVDTIKSIPQQPQVQYDLEQQLRELRQAANKLGLYDAADFLNKFTNK